MVKIGKFKVLEKSLKRSFSNVRLDILNIKGYLEKQHDILNSELSELQSQLFTVNRELKDSKKKMGEDYVQKKALEKRLKTQIRNIKDLQSELDGTDSKINKIKKDVSRLERDSITASEFNKKNRSVKRELHDIRDELDDEFEIIGDELREIKDELSKELIRNQSKMLNRKIREMDKSLDEVDELKEELRAILEKANNREKVKKEVTKLEKRISKKPFYKRAWDGFVDFFEEDEVEVIIKETKKKSSKKKAKKEGLGKKIWNGIVIFFTEDVEDDKQPAPKKKKKKAKKKKKKKQRKVWPIVLILLLLLIGAGFAAWKFQDEIAGAFSSLIKEGDVAEVEVEPGEEITEPEEINGEAKEGIVIEVYEGELVSIVPDVSDDDPESVTYTFSEPLSPEGQWQTAEGDAGIYPITVTVSDGEFDSEMEFTLFVKPLQD